MLVDMVPARVLVDMVLVDTDYNTLVRVPVNKLVVGKIRVAESMALRA